VLVTLVTKLFGGKNVPAIFLVFLAWDVAKTYALPEDRREHSLTEMTEFVRGLLASSWYAWAGWPIAAFAVGGWYLHSRSWSGREKEMGRQLSAASDKRDPRRLRVSSPPNPEEYLEQTEREAAALLDGSLEAPHKARAEVDE
jgi:hypothetical protein